MPIIDNFIDRKIGQDMLAENVKKESEHKSSGKLSASMLGQPLQWQVLKILGVEKEPLDEYVVRKFERGHQIEKWVLKYFDLVSNPEKQEWVEYRNVGGYIDGVVDTKNWDFPIGIAPVEIKSVANAKYKRIITAGQPDRSHLLQACLYGLAKGVEKVAISYVASDDYRVQTFIIKVGDYKAEIDSIIDKFDSAMKSMVIPVFEPVEKWQANPKYNNYSEWAEKSEKELKVLSKKLFANLK